MVIQLRFKDDSSTQEFIDKVKTYSCETVGSKAFVQSAKGFIELTDKIEFLDNQIHEQGQRIIYLENLISKIDNSCREVLEITGQQDLIS